MQCDLASPMCSAVHKFLKYCIIYAASKGISCFIDKNVPASETYSVMPLSCKHLCTWVILLKWVAPLKSRGFIHIVNDILDRIRSWSCISGVSCPMFSSVMKPVSPARIGEWGHEATKLQFLWSNYRWTLVNVKPSQNEIFQFRNVELFHFSWNVRIKWNILELSILPQNSILQCFILIWHEN